MEDFLNVENCYLKDGRGELWIVEDSENATVIDTAGYTGLGTDSKAVKLRRVLLLSGARG